MNQEVAPTADQQHAGQHVGARVLRFAQRLPQGAHGILEQVAPHARAGIDGGQDEQRLEHDGEVIPQVQPAAPRDIGEDGRHARRQRGGAARAAKEGLFLNLRRQAVHGVGAHHQVRPGGLQPLRDAGRPGGGIGAAARDVHAEIDARVHRAGGDQRHDRHQRFQAHRAIAHRPRVRLARQHLGRRAAGDQGVEARRSRRRQW